MLKLFGGLLTAQIIKPLGLLAQFAFIARSLGPTGMSEFIELFVLGVLLSIATDLGQRQLGFAAVRTASNDTLREVAAVNAIQVKLTCSALAFIAVILAWLAGIVDIWSAAAVVGVAITAPVGDVSVALLRALGKPAWEIRVSAAEQIAILILLALLASNNALSAFAAVAVFIAVGAARLCCMFAAARQHIKFSRAQSTFPKISILQASLVTAVSILISTSHARLPIIVLADKLEPAAFSVFGSFWTLLLRGELVIAALIQTGFRSNSQLWRQHFSRPWAIATYCFIYGCCIALILWVARDIATSLFLGAKFVEEANFAVYAAVLMTLIYPVFALRTLLQYVGRPVVAAFPLAAVSISTLIVSSVWTESAVPVAAVFFICTALCSAFLVHRLTASGETI